MEIPDSYKQSKPIVREVDFWVDPDQDSPAGLLLSDRIKFYREKVNLIHPFDDKFLEPASYTLHAGGEYLIHDEGGKRISGVLEAGGKVIIPPNGLIYIRFLEEVNIPHYMIGRFNLRVKQVYRGLLLGTGPQVDPGFRGHLGCPLHNFTNEEKMIPFFESLITIDFEKTTPLGKAHFSNTKPEDLTPQYFAQMRHGLIVVAGIGNHPCKIYNKPQDRPLNEYLPGGESVQSSVFELQKTVKQLTEKIKSYRNIAIWSAIGLVIAIVGGLGNLVLTLYTNLETNSFNGYVNLKDNYQNLQNNISELSRTVGQLQGARESVGSSSTQLPNTPAGSLVQQPSPAVKPSFQDGTVPKTRTERK